MKQLRVSAIQDGTVIDHIPPASLFKIAAILGTQDIKDETLVANNLLSKKLGHKGIIKLSNVFLSQVTIDKIALLAHNASIITIKNYEVKDKQIVKLPEALVDSVRCFNPVCITNHESTVTRFEVLDKQSLKLRCHYCEKVMDKSQITFR